MTYLFAADVQNPNSPDPAELAKLIADTEMETPDFYIWYPHPTNPGEICHIACRELDRGEIFTLDSAFRDKLPEVPEAYQNVLVQNYNAEQRKWYAEFEKETHKLECERNILATVQVILDDRWTEELVRKLLPKRTCRSAYRGGTMALRETDPIVNAFSYQGTGGTQANTSEVPRSTTDEP